MYLRSGLLTTSAEQAAEAILGESIGYAEEYEQVQARIAEQSANAYLRYADYCAIEEATAYLLYMLIRHTRPSQVLELGVADGRSTQVILSALDANDHGRLLSVDITDEVGGLAAGHPRWRLHVRSRGRSSRRELKELLADVGPPDLFFHDAMHTYHEQYADYLDALDYMLPGSVFVSDDVDHSFAFLDIMVKVGVEPVVLVDSRKAVGAFLLPGVRPDRHGDTLRVPRQAPLTGSPG
jgi:predicted O-methyltransferase YrrM